MIVFINHIAVVIVSFFGIVATLRKNTCTATSRMLSNVIREIAESTAYTQFLCAFGFGVLRLKSFRVLGLSAWGGLVLRVGRLGKSNSTGPAQIFEHVEG